MESQFALSIEIGNDAMRKPSHVAKALREIAARLEHGETEGSIRDLNGNRVGSFTFKA